MSERESPVRPGTISREAASGPTVRRFPAGHFYERNERLVLGLVGLAGILAAWEIGAQTRYLNPVIMSSPSAVLRALLEEFRKGEIWAHLAVSVQEYLLGLTLAVTVGIVIGFAAGWWRRANYLLDPWITVLYSTPSIAVVPMIVLILGIGIEAKVFIVFVFCVVTIIINTMIGVQTASGSFLDVARVFGASETKQVVSVVIPGALPFLITGLRLAGGQALVGVIGAELLAGQEGLGYVLNHAAAALKSSTVLLVVLLLGIWGILFAEIMRRVEAHFEAWRP